MVRNVGEDGTLKRHVSRLDVCGIDAMDRVDSGDTNEILIVGSTTLLDSATEV